jgi:hypothetical protein
MLMETQLIGFGVEEATGPVTFDANSSAVATASAATSISSSNLTVGTGANRAVVMQIGFSSALVTGISATWDGIAMTLIASVANGLGGLVALFGIVNPASGAKSLSVSWTGSSDAKMNAVSWINVSQVGGSTTFYSSATATGTTYPTTGAVVSSANDAAMDVVTTNANLSAPTQTQTALNTTGAYSFAGSRASGAGISISFQWTGNNTFPYAQVVTAIKAA